MCQVLVHVGNVLLVLERTTARLCHIKVVSPLPKCGVKAVCVYVSTTPRLKAFGYFLVLRNSKYC